MPAAASKVLLGDSTPSNLTPNVLDVIVELVRCVTEIGQCFVKVYDVHQKLDKLERTTEQVVSELDKFCAQAELGVRAVAKESKRIEVQQHGEEVAVTVTKMVDSWKGRYAGKLASEQRAGEAERDRLQQAMQGAVETFLVPMRADAQQWWQRRVLSGEAYDDTIIVEPIPGLRITMTAQDAEPEVPRRMRTLLGKGNKVQIGFKKKTLIRRSEEPAWLSLDDLVIVESETSPTRARLVLTKKLGGKEAPIQLEIVMTDGGPSGSAILPDGTAAALPASDRPTMNAVFEAVMGENERLFAAPARLVSLSLDGDEVDDANGMLGVAERMVDTYRPIIAEIAEHSPNVDELTIKIEQDGKREETWIRRDELAEHLATLPDVVYERLAIAELGAERKAAVDPTEPFDPDTSLDDLPTFDAPGGLADLLEPEADEAAATAGATGHTQVSEPPPPPRTEAAAPPPPPRDADNPAARADTILEADDVSLPKPPVRHPPPSGLPKPAGGLPKPAGGLPKPSAGLPRPKANDGASKPAGLDVPRPLGAPAEAAAPASDVTGDISLSDLELDSVDLDEPEDEELKTMIRPPQ